MKRSILGSQASPELHKLTRLDIHVQLVAFVPQTINSYQLSHLSSALDESSSDQSSKTGWSLKFSAQLEDQDICSMLKFSPRYEIRLKLLLHVCFPKSYLTDNCWLKIAQRICYKSIRHLNSNCEGIGRLPILISDLLRCRWEVFSELNRLLHFQNQLWRVYCQFRKLLCMSQEKCKLFSQQMFINQPLPLSSNSSIS